MGVIVDPGVLPGLLLLAVELAVLAGLGYVVVRVALRQDDELSALAQGLVVGPALWGIVVNFIMYAVPGMAGAAVGWVLMPGLAAVLAWRSPERLGVSTHRLAGFVVAVVVLGWVGLASRQLLTAFDPHTNLGLAASIRAGAFPVSLPWHADAPASYHYGASLLAGLLAPPGGPDLAFTWELLGVYAWLSFALVVVTALRRRGSWLPVLVLSPLLLSYGAHTFVWNTPSLIEGILRLPVPSGWPSAGLRAALADIYWAPVAPVGSRPGSLPDVWNPAFPLGYGLVLIVLAQASRSVCRTWPGSLTLSGLVGFLGLLVTTLAPVVLGLWAGLEIWRLTRARRGDTLKVVSALPSGAALAVSLVLLLFGGGALSGILGGGTGWAGLAWTTAIESSHWRAVGSVDERTGGMGLLSLGPVALAGIAIALGRRDRLVVALAAGAGLLSLAWLALDYPPFPQDLRRLAGHSRNLAILALLLALSARFAGWRSRRWRAAAVALLVGLVVWPTVVAPARSLAGAVGEGVQLANAGWGWPAAQAPDAAAEARRYRMPRISGHLAAYIRDHVDLDAHILDPTADLAVLLSTGRPNNLGFADVTQLVLRPGPDYLDARHHLEPAAFRRLGLAYVYAPEAWEARLTNRARGWLADPGLFDLLARDGDEALYRVRPEFLALETAPHPESFEALRAAVPPGREVYLPPNVQAASRNQLPLLRVASAVPQARLVGAVHPERLHLRTPAPWHVAPLGTGAPDFVALPRLHEAWLYPPAAWREVWRNQREMVAVYTPAATATQLAAATTPAISVKLADVRAVNAHLAFMATLAIRAPPEWSGQDWVLVPTDGSPWGIPVLESHVDRRGLPVIEQWFAGQAAAGTATTTHSYELDTRASSLAVRGADGAFAIVQASSRAPSPGDWMLALRLTRREDRGVQDIVAIVPTLRFTVANDGTVSDVQVYESSHGWRPA